jgi:hypothetical protein
MTADRSVSKILSDIIANGQEIVRGEIRLARTEALEKVAQSKTRIALIGAGLVTMLFAMTFLLVSAYEALLQVLPPWSAALIVSVATAVIATVLLKIGMKPVEQPPSLKQTVDVIKEKI